MKNSYGIMEFFSITDTQTQEKQAASIGQGQQEPEVTVETQTHLFRSQRAVLRSGEYHILLTVFALSSQIDK